jgi:PiT family inorganic phosphate transporter
MQNPLLLLVLSILIALVFEFTNGFHDAANVVSTVIATKVLKPIVAIILAAILNLIGATQTSRVTETIIEGFLPLQSANQLIILSTLIGAICWNLLTWVLAIPSSSSYALVGGIVGSGIVSIGYQKIFWGSIIYKVVIPMILSPIIGFFLSLFLMKLL